MSFDTELRSRGIHQQMIEIQGRGEHVGHAEFYSFFSADFWLVHEVGVKPNLGDTS